MSVHGPVNTYQLSAEELAKYDAILGKPTKPLNYYKGRLYTKPPKEATPVKICDKDGCNKKHYAKGYCCSCYYKLKGMGLI